MSELDGLPDIPRDDWSSYQSKQFQTDSAGTLGSTDFRSWADQRIEALGPAGGPDETTNQRTARTISEAFQPGEPAKPPQPIQPTEQETANAASAVTGQPLSPPPAGISSQPDPYGWRALARQKAAQYNVNPDVFESQIQQESGFAPDVVYGQRRSSAGALGIAQFMPDTAKSVGLDDPFNPDHALDAAARHDAQLLKKYGGDYSKALAAYNAGEGNVDKYNGIPPFDETQAYVRDIMGRVSKTGDNAPTPAAVKTAMQDISQFGDRELTPAEAYAACGPAAAVRLATSLGRQPTLREALDAAKGGGLWDEGNGMHGLGSESTLLKKMGVDTQTVTGPQWALFAQEAATHNPVVISTSNHYFTADGVRTNQNGEMEFHVGQSGKDLAHGSEWMTPTQMTNLMGTVQGGLLTNHPAVAADSLASNPDAVQPYQRAASAPSNVPTEVSFGDYAASRMADIGKLQARPQPAPPEPGSDQAPLSVPFGQYVKPKDNPLDAAHLRDAADQALTKATGISTKPPQNMQEAMQQAQEAVSRRPGFVPGPGGSITPFDPRMLDPNAGEAYEAGGEALGRAAGGGLVGEAAAGIANPTSPVGAAAMASAGALAPGEAGSALERGAIAAGGAAVLHGAGEAPGVLRGIGNPVARKPPELPKIETLYHTGDPHVDAVVDDYNRALFELRQTAVSIYYDAEGARRPYTETEAARLSSLQRRYDAAAATVDATPQAREGKYLPSNVSDAAVSANPTALDATKAQPQAAQRPQDYVATATRIRDEILAGQHTDVPDWALDELNNGIRTTPSGLPSVLDDLRQESPSLARSMDRSTPEAASPEVNSSAKSIHEGTGLPLNEDGTVTVYHGTTADGAAKIQRTGRLQSAGEPDVYVTTDKNGGSQGTGYGDGTVVPVRVNPDRLILDDEFPNGRRDFRIDTGKPGGSVPVGIEPPAPATSQPGSRFTKPASQALYQQAVQAAKEGNAYKAFALRDLALEAEKGQQTSPTPYYRQQPNPFTNEAARNTWEEALIAAKQGNTYDALGLLDQAREYERRANEPSPNPIPWQPGNPDRYAPTRQATSNGIESDADYVRRTGLMPDSSPRSGTLAPSGTVADRGNPLATTLRTQAAEARKQGDYAQAYRLERQAARRDTLPANTVPSGLPSTPRERITFPEGDYPPGLTRLGTDTRPNLANPGDLTRSKPENLPNQDVFQRYGATPPTAEGEGYKLPPASKTPITADTRNLPKEQQVRQVVRDLVPHPRIPRDLHEPGAEQFADDTRKNGEGLATGKWKPESTALSAVLTKLSIGRGITSGDKMFRAIGEEAVASTHPSFQTQTGSARAQTRGLVIRPEVVATHIAGNTTDPVMMQYLTALSRPSVEEGAPVSEASFATRLERQAAIERGVREFYDKARTAGWGAIEDKEMILGKPRIRNGQPQTPGPAWMDSLPQTHQTFVDWAKGEGAFAGLNEDEKRTALVTELTKTHPSGIGSTKVPFMAAMSVAPDYGIADLRMRRDVFGLDPKQPLTAGEIAELEQKLVDTFPSNSRYVSQWKPWAFLTDEKVDYGSIPKQFNRVNDFMAQAETIAKEQNKPVGEVVGDLAKQQKLPTLSHPDPSEVEARIGITGDSIRALHMGAGENELKKAAPELWKFAEQSGVKIVGKPGVGGGGWLSDETGKMYREGDLDLTVKGPQPGVRFFTAAMILANPREEAALIAHQGAGIEMPNAISHITVRVNDPHEAAALEDAATQLNPSGWHVKGQFADGLATVTIASPDKNASQFEGTVRGWVKALETAGFKVESSSVEPAQVEFMARPDVERIIYGGPRGAFETTDTGARSATADARGIGSGASEAGRTEGYDRSATGQGASGLPGSAATGYAAGIGATAAGAAAGAVLPTDDPLERWKNIALGAAGGAALAAGGASTARAFARQAAAQAAERDAAQATNLDRAMMRDRAQADAQATQPLLSARFQGRGQDLSAEPQQLPLPNPERYGPPSPTQAKTSLGAKINAASYANLLSGWYTHLGNIGSNTGQSLARPIITLAEGRPIKAAQDLRGMIGGFGDGVVVAYDTLRLGASQSPTVNQTATVRPRAFGNGILGRTIEAPTDLLAAADAFFQTVNYAGSQRANAWQMAKGNPAVFERLMIHPTPELQAKAALDARMATYTENPGEVVNRLMHMRDTPGPVGTALNFVMPFMRTPANIVRRGLLFTAQPVVGPVKAAAAFKRGDTDAARTELAKTLLAAGMAGGLAAMATQGDLSGNGPTDAGKRNVLERQGWQPNSIKVQGKWYNYQQFGPLAIQMAVVANAVEGWQEAQAKPDDAQLVDQATSVVNRVKGAMIDASPIKGFADLLKADRNGKTDTAKIVAGLVSRYIPASGLMNNLGQVSDPYTRKVDPGDFAGQMASRVPVLRNRLPAAMTYRGEPLPNPRYQQPLNVMKASPVLSSPQDTELQRLGVGAPDIGKTGPGGIPLSPDERRQAQVASGPFYDQTLGPLFNSSRYQGAQRGPQTDAAKAALSGARDAGIATILRQVPPLQLRQRAADEARKKAEGK